MEKKIIITALILGMISIILGAFGAHALKKVLQPEQLTSFETGVRYQMYHALFLLFIATTNMIALKEKAVVFYLALVGVILFSGSIYLLSTSAISGLKLRFIGPVTPLGGLLLIGSWAYLLYALLLKNNN
ncbi:DUF423 domain-containing protein [Flavobacterium haoranii]|uniref:Uncharacterized membrane protein YgdD, TMEM256/DUF423 family n=1 Tax=Flavobacterium haoranii TaxID=683124 RepID=A0A1M6FLC8_9FLAO|nr:DUF423 domain-containing protein [Flavobacterium haoranii]SHI98511.1 Uncharacterized membrane protein YgdD, TMEM256/DUF423 family [Flavobacterium haoranii]